MEGSHTKGGASKWHECQGCENLRAKLSRIRNDLDEAAALIMEVGAMDDLSDIWTVKANWAYRSNQWLLRYRELAGPAGELRLHRRVSVCLKRGD